MKTALKTMHYISIAIFLGSIITYIFLGASIPENTENALLLNRQEIAAATKYLTIPAMLLTGITGIAMSGKPKTPWLWIKLIGFTGIMLNTTLFIYPAILTSLSLINSQSPAYFAATQQEAIFGAANLLIIITLIVIAIKKPNFKNKDS